MWIGLLGSLPVRVDGTATAIPAARQRALLAVLAVRAGELVPTDELAETVWDPAVPRRGSGGAGGGPSRPCARPVAGVRCWPYFQATVLIHLGDTQHAAGQAQAARRARQEAVAILDALHHSDAGLVRAKLRPQPPAQPPGTTAESPGISA